MPSVNTPIGRFAFTHLFKPYLPKKAKPGQRARFETDLILTAADLASPQGQALKKAISACAVEKFGKEKVKALSAAGKLRSPIRACTAKVSADGKRYTGYEDDEASFLKAWSYNPPGVIGPRREELEPHEVYAGQHGRLHVTPFAYDTDGNYGVGLMLEGAQVTRRNAERLDGRVAAKDAFDEVVDDSTGGDEDDTRRGADDYEDEDIPF